MFKDLYTLIDTSLRQADTDVAHKEGAAHKEKPTVSPSAASSVAENSLEFYQSKHGQRMFHRSERQLSALKHL